MNVFYNLNDRLIRYSDPLYILFCETDIYAILTQAASSLISI